MKVSCIIPAYNEEGRIKNVLDIVTQCSLINEIIVVDDYSSDGTSKIVEKYPQVTLFKHQVNRGKSISVYDGVKKSSGNVLLFLDADLINLSEENLKNIILPIINEKADISISLRGNAPWLWKYIGIDYISGERCFSKDLLADSLENIKTLNGFALEVFLNKLIIKNKLKIKIIPWQKVISPFKRKFLGVHFDFLIMGITVMKEVSIFEIISQIISLRRLRV
jgi:glycosyltransferase involved in cell wall biosynthesis